MRFAVRDVGLFASPATARQPFRFGAATLTRATTLLARVVLEIPGVRRAAVGHSADLLVPKWFRKDPARSVDEDVAELVASACAAASAFTAVGAVPSAFEAWWRVYRDRAHALPADAPERLVRGFGVALVERAVLDALCRAAGRSLLEALHEDVLGFRPGLVDREARAEDLTALLPSHAPTSIRVRHTVGLADPLWERDVVPGERLDDGLPESLEAAIRATGVDHFKVKIGAGVDADRERLLRIAEVLQNCVPHGAKLSLDGNEQYADLADVVRLLEAVEAEPRGRRLLAGLLFVEQPVPRARTFDPAHAGAIRVLTRFAPLVIDEADGGIGDFERALALGYRGVSAKSCKGVFLALLNRLVCARSTASGAPAFQTGEDLTTLPVLALQQDLALAAALGLEHVERNGHHYFAAFDHLPPGEAAAARTAHPDLYAAHGVRIEQGHLSIGSLGCAGLGHAVAIDTGSRECLFSAP